MTKDSFSSVVRDRHRDPALTDHLVDKPPILRRATLRWLCVACLAVIIYGTVGPLGLGGKPWLVPSADWQWTPPWQHSDANDLSTNFLVYVPVGFAFRLLVRRRGFAGMPDLLLGLSLSVGLSYATEIVQQFMPARSANLQDCLVNGVAALVGCLVAVPVQRWLRQTHSQAFETRKTNSWTLLAWTAAIVTGGLMVVPLYPDSPSIEVTFTRALDIVDIRRFGMFAVVGFCMAAAAIQRLGDRPGAVVRSAMIPTLLMAVCFELAQTYIATHACGLLDMFIAALGGVSGCAAAAKAAELGIIGDGRSGRGAKPGRSHGLLQAVALVATAMCVLALGLRRVWSSSTAAFEELSVRWTPFHAHFLQPFHRAVTDLFEMLATYAVLTLLCLLVSRGRGRALALLLVVSLAGLVESARLLWGHGTADTTPVIVAVVAWALTSRIWTSLTPHASRPASLALQEQPSRAPRPTFG